MELSKIRIREKCPHCKSILLRKPTCGDCQHHYQTPFDFDMCDKGRKGTRLCKEFTPDSSLNVVIMKGD